MTDTFLSSELHGIADEVQAYLRNNMGIRKINVESPIPNVEISPTLNGKSSNGYLVWVEVSESTYPSTLDSLISDSFTNDLPVKIYVANPASDTKKINQKEVRRLSKKGIGYLIVSSDGVEVIREALELSLFLPEAPIKLIPRRHRPAINEAWNTYRNGNPVKGVVGVCDEIEDRIRKIAKKAKKCGAIPLSCRVNLDKGSLENVIDQLKKHSIFTKKLSGKCYALTDIRNDSSHPPKNYEKRKIRHKKLKTNFNWSIDLLKELHEADK